MNFISQHRHITIILANTKKTIIVGLSSHGWNRGLSRPSFCNISGDATPLETTDGTVIANGYNRIVIGDYGAFVEFSRVQAYMRRLKIKEGQVYRIEDPRYAEHVKYLWLTANDSSDVKVYEQKRPVEYADYKPGMLYVSVYEVFPHI